MRPLAAIAVLAIGGAMCGCAISGFDDLREHAWSDSRSQPAAIDSAEFPVAVTTIDRGLPGATIVAAGASPFSLTTMSYDSTGGFRHAGIQRVEEFVGPPVIAGAGDSVAGLGVVAVAGLETGVVQLFDGRTGLNGPELLSTISLSEACGIDVGAVSAMEFAQADAGDMSEPDLVVMAGGELVVLVDIAPGTTPDCVRCSLEDGQGAAADGVALAVVDVGGGSGEAVAVSVAGKTGVGGSVWIVDPQTLVSGGMACPAASIRGPLQSSGATPDPSFGATLAAGDFDADEVSDLAIASSERQEVVVALNMDFDAVPLSVEVPADSSGFGAQLAFGDFDGEDGDELVVASPSATRDGVSEAGLVSVYSLGAEGPALAASLWDSTPEAGQRFGSQLAVAELIFGADDADLLVIGARDEVFTYFVVVSQGEVEDPRFE